jgi:Flp pilus assembly pilin Flp
VIARALRALLRDDSAVALPEYALALALISIGAMLALAGVALAGSAAFTTSSNAMQTYNAATPP